MINYKIRMAADLMKGAVATILWGEEQIKTGCRAIGSLTFYCFRYRNVESFSVTGNRVLNE
jgi:hypothetical protein